MKIKLEINCKCVSFRKREFSKVLPLKSNFQTHFIQRVIRKKNCFPNIPWRYLLELGFPNEYFH
jgi:hypothetical protein